MLYFCDINYQEMVKDHQERRALVTNEVMQQFMEIRPLEF